MPQGRDILIKIGAASYCHTDYVAAAGEFPGTQLPQIPSHEGCGTVAALGPEAPKSLKVGDRVAVAGHYHPCCIIPTVPNRVNRMSERGRRRGMGGGGEGKRDEMLDRTNL